MRSIVFVFGCTHAFKSFVMIDFKDSEVITQMLDLCFYESSYAKLIVSAKGQQVLQVNEMYLEVFEQTEQTALGKLWNAIDSVKNYQHYSNYIKEINSNDKVEFIINCEINKKKKCFHVEYYLGVLAGEVVYFGTIQPENTKGLSNNTFKVLTKIYNTDTLDLTFPSNLNEVREELGLEFLSLIEIHNSNFNTSISVGDKNLVKSIMQNYSEQLLLVVNTKNELVISIDNTPSAEMLSIMKEVNLHTLCIYPIYSRDSIFGVILGGAKSNVDSLQTLSLLLQALCNQSKFCLFSKTIVNQRKIEGQIDRLTKLPNRNSMTTKFSEIMIDGISSEKYLSLMIVDIHKINFYNKKLGSALTDEIIINVSRLIVRSIGTQGQVYRLSADEFTVLLHPHMEKSLVDVTARRIIKNISRPFVLSNGEDIHVNFNIGVSVFPDDGQTISSMMKNADLALYDANLAGRNNYLIFKYSETGQALKQKTEMEENLKIAIEKGHIHAFYQPKIHAVSEDIIGFEALVRWIDPDIGMINPGQFIPIAEETGLIKDIGEIVAKQSCGQLIKWQKKFGMNLTCSINLSVVQLMDNKLPKKLEKIINTSGIHPHFIDFEITETISLDNVPNLMEVLNQIVEIGCTLSIDDFGTGHSSLDYVKRIPANYIKIDQSFVKNIGLNPEDEAILDATINIAKRLNRKLVAEGVETELQREYLLDKDCDYFQGFLFSRPLPVAEVDILLATRIKLMGSG